MPYGVLQRIISKEYNFEDMVLIESPFVETTRSGRRLCSVQLALTPSTLIIATGCINNYNNKTSAYDENLLDLRSLHPLESVKLRVFKKSCRRSLKICFCNNVTRYFELGANCTKKIFWKLWCNHVIELNSESKLWPFSNTTLSLGSSKLWNDLVSTEFTIQSTELDNPCTWTDKYLYLGSKREAEDCDRPKPIPGLGPTEDIKLLYLKPEYFGCWDQAEHWVQCGNSTSTCDYDVYTYTGEPTSNVTYTSLISKQMY